MDSDAVSYGCDDFNDTYNPNQLETGGDNIGDACDRICGDVNADLTINIFDVMNIISYLYTSGPPPVPLE